MLDARPSWVEPGTPKIFPPEELLMLSEKFVSPIDAPSLSVMINESAALLDPRSFMNYRYGFDF
jgi:hypothetical protein